MRKAWLVLGAAAAVVAATPSGEQGGEPPLVISAVRFYSPTTATTTIEGVCELRLAAVATTSAPMVRYRLEVSVRDSTGLELQHSGWTRDVPGAVATAPGASAVETFVLPPAAPGRYQLVVRAVPATGPAVERAIDVTAYATRPAVSDLLLATDARAAQTDTGSVGAGEIRRGSLVLRTAPVPHLTPTEATLSYYAEVYPWQGATLDGELSVAVLGARGHEVLQTSPKAVHVSPAGGVTEGSLDLAGLPAGGYRLELRVRLGDSTLVEDAPFAMGRVSTVAVNRGPAADSTADPFANATESDLDSMYAPLVYLMKSGEAGVYNTLAPDGKRRFLQQFWAGRGPAQMKRFYGAVDFANQAFRQGGAGQVPGWRTDRGRIYLKNGRWDEILQRPMASPSPYEVWKYTRGRQRYYVFLDRTGLGDYQLIGTNDRQEAGLQSWQQTLGSANYADVAQFLGLTSQPSEF